MCGTCSAHFAAGGAWNRSSCGDDDRSAPCSRKASKRSWFSTGSSLRDGPLTSPKPRRHAICGNHPIRRRNEPWPAVPQRAAPPASLRGGIPATLQRTMTVAGLHWRSPLLARYALTPASFPPAWWRIVLRSAFSIARRPVPACLRAKLKSKRSKLNPARLDRSALASSPRCTWHCQGVRCRAPRSDRSDWRPSRGTRDRKGRFQ
mmetsp:Transcript_117982/g.338397  ORF Transcript_117982/g.338397 Transcript_117982/m.338397 type:complete len:205 (+) Transcript_117982:648-1262(+)